jgi:hypothetical protein
MTKHMMFGLIARNSLRAMVALVLFVAATATSFATPIITGLHLTGTEYPIGTPGGQDSYWEVYALPTAYTGPITAGYQAWVFSGGTPQGNVPRQWYPGVDNGGSDNVGANGARWIGLQQDDATSLFPGNFTPPQPDYNVIYRTTFQADSAGLASFSILTAADNAISLFIGGSVNNDNPYMPTMDGEQIGREEIGLGFLTWINGVGIVEAGTNYLYAVVRDRFTENQSGTVGNYGQIGFLIAAVPEPSSLVLAALGGGVIAVGAIRRRMKRAA